VTGVIRQDDPALTVADPENGVGAMHFSAALYESGPPPDFSVDDLAAMLRDFAEVRNLGEPLDFSAVFAEVFGAASSFHFDDEFIRVWYLSDGSNVILVTYVCDWENRDIESETRESIVKSIQFQSVL
jgi:hypothetical protein